MRPGSNKRSRGRDNGGNPHHNRPRPPHRVQTFESNGPSVKIRGTAYQVFERYVALAREAATGGDRITAESFYQHAEHYFRVMNAAGEGSPHNAPRPPLLPHGDSPPSESGPTQGQEGFGDEFSPPAVRNEPPLPF
jgi:Domain of unknown function (DUF4167)